MFEGGLISCSTGLKFSPGSLQHPGMASQEFQEDRSLDVHLRGSSSEKAHSFGAAGTQQVPRLRFRRANKNRPPSQGAPVEDAHACPVPCCESAER